MLSRLTIRLRIMAGMALLMVLMTISGGQMLLGIRHVKNQFESITSISSQLVNLSALDKKLAEINLLANQFRYSTEKQFFDQLLSKIDGAYEDLDSFEKVSREKEDKEKISVLKADLKSYREDAIKMAELLELRNKLVTETMDVLGPQISSELDAFQKETSGIADISAIAEQLPEDFLALRLQAMKFLVDNKAIHAERFHSLKKKVTEDIMSVNRNSLPASEQKKLEQIAEKSSNYFDAFGRVQQTIDMRNELFKQKMAGTISQLTSASDLLTDEHVTEQRNIITGESAQLGSLSVMSIVIFAVALALGTLGAVLITRSITRPLGTVVTTINHLSQGKADIDLVEDTHKTEIGELLRACVKLRETVGKNLTLQTMVDNLAMPVMMADSHFNITYMNTASTQALQKVEKFLPVPINRIVGSSIDIFHKNPAHQRGILHDRARLPFSTKFKIGPEWLALTAKQLPSHDGSFSGAFIDWRLVTEDVLARESEALAQTSINELIANAQAGNLAQRIDASQLDGFYKSLADGMNSLMDTVIKPVGSAIEVVRYLAHGDLTHTMEGQYAGSFSDMQQALNDTIHKLRDMVRQIRDMSESVSSSASEIADGSQDLSSRTESQASSLEETAASMEEMTGTVKQNAQSARDASNFSKETNTVATRGGEVVSTAISAMNAIEQSSQKISDIIGVIDEIAFQTNLLALNAAVEAARAGEAGKGFAVVASEVRALAGRSSSASKEIKMLIQESVAQVKSGSELVNNTGVTLQEIISSVARVSDIVSSIAHASQEQSLGINQINTTVTQMDEMTQQNAALVEETAAASQSLAQKGEDLKKLIGYFRLNESDQASSTSKQSTHQAESSKKQSTTKRPVKTSKPNGKHGPEQHAEAGWEEF
ncbi:MAG: HAMP domain-containing protein [Rickettsiales bacterium]|nr:HAMP domain-containing protein [Rickettsiales bacterium]